MNEEFNNNNLKVNDGKKMEMSEIIPYHIPNTGVYFITKWYPVPCLKAAKRSPFIYDKNVKLLINIIKFLQQISKEITEKMKTMMKNTKLKISTVLNRFYILKLIKTTTQFYLK